MLVLLATLGACGETSITPEPCIPPAELVAAVNAGPSSPADLRAALQHAAGPMTDALGSVEGVAELRSSIIDAAAKAEEDPDRACRMLKTALAKLDSLPDTPATLPDRDGIRIVLALAARSLASTETP